MDRQSYDALLAEVARLEGALEDLRQDVEGLSVCRDGCGRLDMINEMVRRRDESQKHLISCGTYTIKTPHFRETLI